jgi:hypothetical protein
MSKGDLGDLGRGEAGKRRAWSRSERGGKRAWKKFLCLMINDSQCYNVIFEKWNGNSFLMEGKDVINHSALPFSSTRAN